MNNSRAGIFVLFFLGFWGGFEKLDLRGLDSAQFERGKAIYNRAGACSSCHQPDGKGVLSAFPPLVGSQWVTDNEKIGIKIVNNGMEGPIQVKGVSYDAVMPPQGTMFTDAELADLLTYIRNAWGNKAPAVSKETVAMVRKADQNRVEAWTGGELLPLFKNKPESSSSSKLTGLTYKYYTGQWDRLPDFDQLTPANTGELNDGLISIKVSKNHDNFGLVFEGTLNIEKEDTYKFEIGSDDGSRLLVRGKEVVKNDGVHDIKYKTGTINLHPGPVTLRVEFFEKGGGQFLAVRYSQSGAEQWVALSESKVKQKVESKAPPVMLRPRGKRPAFYRNFIKGAGPRAIGVGYPGGLNLAFDADKMQWAMIWNGDFIDAGLHWTGRGKGFQAPAGKDVISLTGFPPFALLDDPQARWPGEKSRAKNYRFKGYRLDDNDHPGFRYLYGSDVKVIDVPATGVDQLTGKGFFKRQLSLIGSNPHHNLFYIAARGGTINEVQKGVYEVDNELVVSFSNLGNLQPFRRQYQNKIELLVQIPKSNQTISFTQEYRWK